MAFNVHTTPHLSPLRPHLSGSERLSPTETVRADPYKKWLVLGRRIGVVLRAPSSVVFLLFVIFHLQRMWAHGQSLSFVSAPACVLPALAGIPENIPTSTCLACLPVWFASHPFCSPWILPAQPRLLHAPTPSSHCHRRYRLRRPRLPHVRRSSL